jgi:hypothetical protein
MGIRAALDRIRTIEAGLSITSPHALTVKRAWLTAPPAGMKLPDWPAFVNSVGTARQEENFQGSRFWKYQVKMQLLVAPVTVESDVNSLVGLSFWEAMGVAFGADITLGGACDLSHLHSADLLVQLDRPAAQESFVGVTALLDITALEAFTFG